MIGSRLIRVAHVIALALATLVLLASVAAADNLQADLNTSTGGLDKTVDRGTLAASTPQTQGVFLFVDETSGATNNPTYPFSVTLDAATLNGSSYAGASFSGVTISAAGIANGQSGTIGWTTPAAQATSQNYSLVVSFLANTSINESPSAVTITFTIAAAPSDTTPPDTSILSGPDDPTNATAGAFTYTATESGSTFECKLDADAFASCPAGGKGYAGLSEGSHTFAVRATDAAGNTDASPASYSWTIDLTAPDTTIVTAPPLLTNSQSAAFTYSSSESGSTFACELDAGGFASCPAAGKSYAGLGEGTHTFAVRATDAVGNTDASPDTYEWEIDLTPPALSAPELTDASDTGVSQVDDVTKDATPSFTGTAEDDPLVELLRDGSVVDSTSATGGTWSFTSAVLAEGTYDFAARATDAAGNSATSSDLTVVVDLTNPTITPASRLPLANGAGWNNTAVTVTWTCDDALSGETAATAWETKSGEGAGQTANGTCYDAAGNSASASLGGINIDLTNPTITPASRLPEPNGAGWNNTPVTVTWTCDDALSGETAATAWETKSGEGAGQTANGTCYDAAGNSASASLGGINIDLTNPTTKSGEGAGQTANGTCYDLAGNSASDSLGGINIDLTDPYGISWLGGPADGATYYYGFVPAAPTCTASDDLSLMDSCTVTGYGAGVGNHTMMATALDRAGNDATDVRSYSVLAWIVNGFYSPVDNNGVWNTVKGGSTVPLKWEMFAGSTELTDTSLVALEAKQLSCTGTSGPEDPIEMTATGGTSLRYDTTGGQFIYNWQTPKKPGTCYRVTMTADDGSTLTALFKLK